jgi:hypothetical protein
MTQKPYMWNRNNPYQYADPTGFDPCANSIAGCPGKTESAVWRFSSRLERGKALEKEVGSNLPYAFPGIDRSDPAPTGMGLPPSIASLSVTSIKSVDTRLPSYQSTAGLFSRGKQYVDSLAGMPNGQWAFSGAVVLMDPSTVRQLTLVIPKTATLTSDQELALKFLSGYAAANNVQFNVVRK